MEVHNILRRNYNCLSTIFVHRPLSGGDVQHHEDKSDIRLDNRHLICPGPHDNPNSESETTED